MDVMFLSDLDFLKSNILLLQMNKQHTSPHRYTVMELDHPGLLFSLLEKPYFKNISPRTIICKNVYIIVSSIFIGMCFAIVLCFSIEQ